MGLSLNKIFDPRDSLEKARRKELEKFARAHRVDDIKPGMPAPLMRDILRQKGLTSIDLPPTRYLGGPSDMKVQGMQRHVERPPNAKVEELTALDLLKKEWEKTDYSSMDIRQLRKACKEQGIKLKRTDKMTDMVRKLNGEKSPERG